MSRPYYEHGGITIYHGDCREVLPTLLPCEVTITDPPYNVGVNYGSGVAADDRSSEEHDAELAEVLSLCPSPEVIWFPGKVNVFRAGEVCQRAGLCPYWMLGWHRKEFAGDRWLGGPAICWEPIVWASRSESPRFQKVLGHYGRDFLVVNSTHGMPKDHPCPKPLRVMQWLVGMFSAVGETVLDPFMGRGTTLRAAKDHGRQAVGIDKQESYCELAARWMEQEVLDLGGVA